MRCSAAALLVIAVLFPFAAPAHHSRAEYSGDALEIEGKLLRVLWRNPHPGFAVESVGADGRVTVWEVEGFSSLYSFDRAGITRERFDEGGVIRVLGLVSTRRAGRMLATHIMLADGTEAVLQRDAAPHWTAAAHLGGRRNWEAATRAAVVDAAAEDRGIFRVWSYPSPDYATRQHLPFTPAARAANAELDEAEDSRILACGQKSMPGSMLTPNPYEFVESGGSITVRGYEGDVVRTVHLSAAPDAARAAPSRQGFSVGRWEDARTLVIETSRIESPQLLFGGIMLGPDTVVEERYRLSEDQARLDHRITVTDPRTFTEPATFEYYWLALGESFGRYDCDVH